MNSQLSSENNSQTCWALLVGINTYQSSTIPSLRGCRNDVEAMHTFLTSHLHVPATQIRVLVDEEATRDQILAVFEAFLINNPDIKHGDQMLFHFSGHGALMRTPSGWSSHPYIQSLVPYNARTDQVFGIPDRTLGALLDRLAQVKGDQITVILDACHSGSGTRNMQESHPAAIRRIAADLRIPPVDLDADLIRFATPRVAGASGWATYGMPYVLLAGCRDYEQAYEYCIDQHTGPDFWHGVLTYFLLQQLRQLRDRAVMPRYLDILQSVAAQVTARYPQQTPQCEGAGRTRIAFGNAHIAHDPWIMVKQGDANLLEVAAGVLHGVAVGTELAIYAPDFTQPTHDDSTSPPLCTATITAVTATTAQAHIIDPALVMVPPGSHAVFDRSSYQGDRQRVFLQSHDELHDLRLGLQAAIQQSPYLTLQASPQHSFDLCVAAETRGWCIYAADGTLLVHPLSFAEHPATLVNALNSIARYQILLNLRNQQDDTHLAAAIHIQLRPAQQGSQGEFGADPAAIANHAMTVRFVPGQEAANHYIIDIVHDSERPVYPHVFILNPDYSIVRLYPKHGQENRIQAIDGQPGVLSVGMPDSGERPLHIDLPDQPRWDSCRDYLKVIVTTKATDLGNLEQPALRIPLATRSVPSSSGLNQLLDQVLAGTRFGGSARTLADEEWATTTYTLTVVRASHAVQLAAGDTRVALGTGLTLFKPIDFVGTLHVVPVGSYTRGNLDSGPLPPPSLMRTPQRFQPVSDPGARGVLPAGIAFDIEVDERTRQEITSDHPLVLELPHDPDTEHAELFAVAFDGQDYRFVGYPAEQPQRVTIVNLPLIDDPATPTTRGMGRTLRLFFYKKLGRYTPLTGLRRATLENDTVVYRPVQPDQFRQGQSVALFVHGFTSDTAEMIRDVAPFVCAEIYPYDHILAFDFESVGTGIAENGAKLAQALRSGCGFGANDQIRLDIYAHSMGSVVCRCMIELSGGAAFVDRLVMAGPPNRGTTLASSSRGLLYIATAMLNDVGAVPPLSTLNWLLKELYEQGVGLSDLAVDSEVLQRLNALEEPAQTPYLVLAGDNTINPDERNQLNRLAHKILDQSLDTLFGEDHDSVVGTSCMVEVRGGNYPQLTVTRVHCNHFDYFVHPLGQTAIKAWMSPLPMPQHDPHADLLRALLNI